MDVGAIVINARKLLTIAALTSAVPPPAVAIDAAASEAQLSAICTDRPTKSNYACTVEQDHFQYETDLINATVTHADGISTDTWLAPNPTIKYGISATADIEVNLAPLVISREGADSRTLAGLGDLYLRIKYRFVGNNDSVLSAAAIPYVKLPTARVGIGNGAVEEGLIVPVNYKLTDAITLTAVPEIDRLADATGNGRHLNFAAALNVAYSINKRTVLYTELWGDWNHDPAGALHQYSADIAVTYAITDLLQIDVGLNAGLNRATPPIQGYVGLSEKF